MQPLMPDKPRHNRWPEWLALPFYTLAALAVTYPTFLRLGTAFFGYPPDALYYIWLTWWRKFSLLQGLDYFYQPLSQYPFGTEQVVPGFSGLMWPLALLAIPFGEVAAYNLLILLSIVLSGWLAYRVARQFLQRQVVCLIVGLLFAFSPMGMFNILSHIDLAQQWVIPLFMLALIALERRRTALSALGVGAAFALANYINPYYGHAVAVAAVTYALVRAAAQWRRGGWRAALDGRHFALYGLAVVSSVLLFLPELIPVLRETYLAPASPIQRLSRLSQGEFWFLDGSSRPWNFLLPSIEHPVLGRAVTRLYEWFSRIQRVDFAPDWIKVRFQMDSRWFWHSINVAQDGLYLGYANLAVAWYALRQWRRGKLSGSEHAAGGAERGLWVACFLALFVVGALFTLPPYLPVGAVLHHVWKPLHAVVIPLPSLITMELATPLRTTLRIMPLSVLGLAMVVGWGLETLLGRLEAARWRVLAVAVFVLVAGFEYLHLTHLTSFAVPAYARWMADQPPGTPVAVYPYGERLNGAYQTIHEQPLADYMNRAATAVDNLIYILEPQIKHLDQRAVDVLATLGYRTLIVQGQPPSPLPEGIALAETLDGALVYRITARPFPLAVLATPRSGLWTSDADWGWQGETTRIVIWNSLNEAADVTLRLSVAGGFAGGDLEVSRVLTPHPETIIVSGRRIPNPFIPPEYDVEPLAVRVGPDGFVEPALTLQPGETTLILRWVGLPTGNYPPVEGMAVELAGP